MSTPSESVLFNSKNDTPYNALLKDFEQYCSKVINEYEEKEEKVDDDKIILETKYNPKISDIENNWAREVGLLCSKLSNWIYTISHPLPEPVQYQHNNLKPEWIYKRIVPSKSTQIIQWALLQHTKLPKQAYLVFKGSSPDLIFDTIADTGVIPVPIFCEKNDKTYWDFAVHSGMYSSLMRDFHDIWKIINQQIHSFEVLLITGHSLGGGISILFALQTIISEYLPSNKRMAVVVFGAPTVISYEKEFNELSIKSQLILSELHDICHVFVNKFDPISRLPTRNEWMMTVIPYAMRRVIREKIATNSYVPLMWSTIINYGARSAHMKFVKIAGKYMDILQSYHPFGTYYFCGEEKDEPFITKNPKAIEDIFGYVPPHKIIDSSGNSIRVCHFATNIKGLELNQFSLRYLRDLIKLIDDNNDMNKERDDDETESLISDIGIEQKVNLINLLTMQNDYDGEWNKKSCIYIVMQSDDENVTKIIQNRKLSGKNWLQLVSNHVIGEYIELFTHIRIESLSLGHTQHLTNIVEALRESNDNNHVNDESDMKVSIMKRIKKTTSKMFNKFEKSIQKIGM